MFNKSLVKGKMLPGKQDKYDLTIRFLKLLTQLRKNVLIRWGISMQKTP